MTTTEGYLAELERLLADADPAVRRELVDGIREELDGLSPAQADARVRELGDPAFVAAGALAEGAAGHPVPAVPPSRDPAWYPVLTVVLLTIGIVPVLGWFVGLIMLWAAKGWAPAHKVVGTVLAVGGPALLLSALLPWSVEGTVAGGAEAGETVNPLLPPTAPVLLVVALVLIWLAGWVWLLVAANRPRR